MALLALTVILILLALASLALGADSRGLRDHEWEPIGH
jgi:hypothetical protein